MEPKNRPPHPGEDRCPGCDIRIVDAGGEVPTALYLDSQGKVTDAEGTWVCSNCIDSGFGGTTGPGVRGPGGAGGGPGARFTATGKSLPSTADMRREGPAEQRARRLAAEFLVTEDKLTEARRQVRELAGIVGADVVGEVARYIACAAQAEHTRDRLLRLAEAARDARDWIAEAIDRCLAGQRVDLEPLTLAHQRLERLNLGDGEERGVRRG